MSLSRTDASLLRLALARWRYDRQGLRDGRTAHYRRNGWAERRLRDSDARLVRTLDFERALDLLPAEQRAVIIAVDADRNSHAEAARLIECSPRKVAYVLQDARQNLIRILDRLGLL